MKIRFVALTAVLLLLPLFAGAQDFEGRYR
jgi:hypothetical protein